MKILFFVDRLLRGGIQTLLLNLTIQLKNKGVSIDYLLFDDGKEYELEKVMKDMGCGIYKVPMPHINTIIKCLCGLNSFFRSHHDYDLIHAHSSSKAVLPLYYAKKYHIKIRIAHSHNTKFQSHNPFTIMVGDFLKIPLCRISTDYFACSELAGKWLFNNVFAKKIHIYILNNGIVLEDFLYDKNIRRNIRKELGIEDEAIVIGNIGRFTIQKNHSQLLDIFSAYNRLNKKSYLILVGVGELMPIIEKKVYDMGLKELVKFAGFRTDTSRFYQAFDLFLMPSLYEGLPFVGIEAQASGLPCLFSDTVTREVKVLDSTDFMPLTAPSIKWAEKIDRILKESIRNDTYDKMSNSGYNIVLEAERLYQYYRNRIKDEQ